jgi:multicomponent Na+:H+ antiporter subunit C
VTLLFAAVVAAVFGSGVRLLLSRDLIRVVMGMLLVSNAVNLLLMSVGLSRGVAPIHPVPPDVPVSDPLVQALTLTSIVIGFGTAALLLSVVYGVFKAERLLDLEELVEAERRTEAHSGDLES